jgi:predicted DCC family thiol-disulfide oxidoreductase YuxK
MGENQSSLARRADVLLYDDGCAMCAFQTRLLKKLDWGHVVDLMPMSRPEAATLAPNLTSRDLHDAMHCITPCGQVYRGAAAIRHFGMRMPLLWPLALLLWLPGTMWLAERAYAAISRNRYVLSRFFGCGSACAVHAPKTETRGLRPTQNRVSGAEVNSTYPGKQAQAT